MLLLVKTNFPGYLFPVYFLIAHLHGKNTHLSVFVCAQIVTLQQEEED
jgi:hypothetical protein